MTASDEGNDEVGGTECSVAERSHPGGYPRADETFETEKYRAKKMGEKKSNALVNLRKNA